MQSVNYISMALINDDFCSKQSSYHVRSIYLMSVAYQDSGEWYLKVSSGGSAGNKLIWQVAQSEEFASKLATDPPAQPAEPEAEVCSAASPREQSFCPTPSHIAGTCQHARMLLPYFLSKLLHGNTLQVGGLPEYSDHTFENGQHHAARVHREYWWEKA